MAPLSVAISTPERAPEQRLLPTKVIMDDQHKSHHLLIVIWGIIGLAEEIMEKEPVSGVHLYLGGKLLNSCGRRRRSWPAKRYTSSMDQVAGWQC